jgi:outer membrane protein assembly factor BamE (lipoprotein component of BamABCDE complex)
MNLKIVFLSLLVLGFATGCQTNPSNTNNDSNISVGNVQKNIKLGMSGAEVAEVLGSPNIVSTDEKRREVWIYDKVSKNVEYSNSRSFGTLLVIGGSSKSGSSSSSQKTLTIIIKYDEQGKVRDFAYHTSRF